MNEVTRMNINNCDEHKKCGYTTTVISISRKTHVEIVPNISLATHMQFLLQNIDINNIQFDYMGFVRLEKYEKKQIYINKNTYKKLKMISIKIKLPVAKIASAICEGYLN